MSEYAIKVENVSMKFNLGSEKVTSLKEYFIKMINKSYRIDEFYAVKDISFNIKKGDSFAILGSNGSGKSTMLKMISGIYKPTNGKITVEGSIAPMIELGAGFDEELTARENVFLNGAVLGYSKKFMEENFDNIIDFAELWDFVDVPIKNYSSGMKARLGFAVATLVKPDVLIVDEILSVGDANFRKKCEEKMFEMKENGVTLVLVSHSMEQVLKVCNNAIWINKGQLMCIGNVNEVCKEYKKSIN
ncbi:ABC transporter ATP-binding protein [Clostridium sp.]|uniref:ABC transporter ATP-binding protein n=1 Tax=Clostridium sp. TaxID=1506 RepID=UPI00290F4C03|nr:ABC transporter ATP-binding protein [Clostridium sp.]MDU4478784.1 ABC transporter ATP-binding protein [Clostridium sp.]